ncbi:histidine--tRNA ligase [Patulibacter sp. SYSU D01012]|uniref:histidine--tRNA ligase n=1 Tax=Patulibacter sp. SYSU D01012 TaxID=2817381 RepID=UPI001B303018
MSGGGKVTAPRGTHDVLPDEAERRAEVERLAREILGGAGYRRIETPIFEATELFARGVGASTDVVQKEMYTFEDRGERSLTLRPEGTAGVVRSYLEHGMHKLPQPVKLWYWGPFFRYERAQKGRQRQFWQLGIETLGSEDPSVDAEGIVLLHRLLGALGVPDLRLRLGSLGTPAGREGYRELLVAYLREHEDRLSDEVRGRIDLNPLRAFDSDHPGTREVMAGAPLLLDHLAEDDAAHFAEVRALLDGAGVAYEIDPTLVRGLDYYSRTLFEFTSDALGAQSGVGGGGRYDGLMELIGGPATPGFGWGAGIERILLAQTGGKDPEPAEQACDLYVAWADGHRAPAFALADAAARDGLAVRLDQAPARGLKGQLRRADRAGARTIVVVDEDGLRVERGAERGPVADARAAIAAARG